MCLIIEYNIKNSQIKYEKNKIKREDNVLFYAFLYITRQCVISDKILVNVYPLPIIELSLHNILARKILETRLVLTAVIL